MNFTLSEIFFVLVIFQLLLISLFLVTNSKGKRTGNLLLGVFFLTISLNLLDSFLVMKKFYLQEPGWVGWGICLPVLYGPLLYLYTQSILYKEFSMTPGKWLHFLPFILLFLSFETIYLSQSRSESISVLNRIQEQQIPVGFYWSSALIYLQFLIYVGFCFRLIRRYKIIVNEQFSDEQRTNISWLSSTILFFTVCMILAALNAFIRLTPLSNYYNFFLTIIILLLFIFINRVLLKALRRPEIFSIIEKGAKNPATNNQKYSGSSIPEAERKKSVERLRLYMEQHKPYLEPELTLYQLAGQLSLRPKLLSQLINESLHQNFFDFVNRYRIEEAKRLLTNPVDKKITVLEVLYEVGFNSKSSFNTLFKKHTGLTPSEFRKKQLS